MKKRTDETAKLTDKKTLMYALLIIIIITVPTVFVLQIIINRPNKPKAAIIDQLGSSQLSPSSQFPNQTFIETARNLLSQRFDSVDYYSDNASVENYRLLPSRGYKIIIWRAHSALDLDSNYVAISTSERELQTGYEQYMQDGRLTLCNITGDPYLYYAITPKFIREVMSGNFEDTVIILMSCNGLNAEYSETAKALQAHVLISWDGWISSSDNDNATACLLRYLISENYTVSEAVNNISECRSLEFGLSRLHYFPSTSEASTYRIPDYRASAQVMTQYAATTISVPRRLR